MDEIKQEEAVSAIDFLQDKNSSETEGKATKNILNFFKENKHYIDWRKENILGQFTEKILNETDYFDSVEISALPIDEEIQNFVQKTLEYDDTARKAMEQLTDQISKSKTETFRLQEELKLTKDKLENAVRLNQQLVKEKWWQKLLRSFSDYKYKYEVEGAREKK